MGLLKALDKACRYYGEHQAEIMDFMNEQVDKAEKRQQKKYEEEQKINFEFESYKSEYEHLSNQKLKHLAETETGLRKKAAIAVFNKRSAERLKWKSIYSEETTMNLRIEVLRLEKGYSNYSETPRYKIDKENATMRINIIGSILNSRGEL